MVEWSRIEWCFKFSKVLLYLIRKINEKTLVRHILGQVCMIRRWQFTVGTPGAKFLLLVDFIASTFKENFYVINHVKSFYTVIELKNQLLTQIFFRLDGLTHEQLDEWQSVQWNRRMLQLLQGTVILFVSYFFYWEMGMLQIMFELVHLRLCLF